jgi:uncharacterized protein
MKNQFEGIEPMVLNSMIKVPYSWWAGETASAFMKSLQDEGAILGRKCADCGKVYVPPRKVCPACFKEMEWMKVADTGTLITYTVVLRKLAALPKDPPVIYGLIKLDGADTAILHMINEIDPSKVKIGMRFKARFSEARKGTIRDIEYFAPTTE